MKPLIKRLLRLVLDCVCPLVSLFCRGFKVKNCFECPICGYYGFFLSTGPETGKRKHARCLRCGSLERHRIQFLTFRKICQNLDTKSLDFLHFAPEAFFSRLFKDKFKSYLTADLYAKHVDRKEDLTKLTFEDSSFDIIYASHVLEHIKDDGVALSEIRRVLRPGGIAVIPVPLIGKETIEYPEANPHEYDHVRCPGEDYYKRYNEYFSKISFFRSKDFDEKYQLYVYENRTSWPDIMPLRPTVDGEKHEDIVPVCYK